MESFCSEWLPVLVAWFALWTVLGQMSQARVWAVIVIVGLIRAHGRWLLKREMSR